MSKKLLQKLFIPSLLVLIPLLFFYKTVLFQKVPFPGDLLLANYEPYKSEPTTGVVTTKGQGADVIRELYPWKYLSIESLKRGVFPLWNPYVLSGNPHFASFQSGTLYPGNFVFFLMPFVSAWSLYIILQYILALSFTYLYLRTIKLSKIASLFGGVAFSFCAFLTVWGEYGNVGHSIAFLPLSLLAIEKALDRKLFRWYLLLILSLVFSICAGYIQMTLYILIVDMFYIGAKYFTQKKKDTKSLLLLIGSILVSILISAVELLPLYELVNLSLRASYNYKELLSRLMPFENSITLLAPDFFGNPATMNYFLQGGSTLERAANIGVWPLVLGVSALFSKRSFYRNFFLVSAFVIYLTTISLPPVALFHSIGIPFLSTGIPTRILAIFSFCLAISGAIGLDSFVSGKSKYFLRVLVVFSVIFAILWAATFLINNPVFAVSRRNLIIPTGVFIVGLILLCFKVPRKIVAIVFLLLTVSELMYSFQKFNSFVPARYAYPSSIITQKLRNIQGIDRSWGYGNAYIDTEFQIMEGIYTTDGYNPLFSKSYGELLSASENGKVPPEVQRSVANIYKGYGVNDLKQNPYRQRALNLTGVKYVVNKKGDLGVDSAFDQSIYDLIWEKDGWQIYKNKSMLPRVKLFGNVKIVDNKKEAIRTLYSPDFDYLNTLVFLKNEYPSIEIKKDETAEVKVLSYGQNDMTIETSTRYPQYLFISDNNFPGWKAEIKGDHTVKAPVFTANYSFRAIPVPAGKHTIHLYYAPSSFIWGIAISIISLLGLIIAGLFATMKKAF